ncbi:MAG: aminoglycoside phosphotransferase family protein [Candidatus Dormibacteraeota bacterium]|nr:aminoglycoside phosphotransferase family protein [Candidatus Dormibacteraeota bacterium]
MDQDLASGIERALFGAVRRDTIDGWLSSHLRARLGVDLSQIVFRSGRIAAVYGATLDDGRQVAVKVHRRPADLAYLGAAIACQRRLAAAGYPCPRPLDGPATTDGLTAVIETLLTDGLPGDAHEPSIRRAMAEALFEQLELLRGAAVDGLRAGAPAWSHYEHGPWPVPHDPIFDFTITLQAFAWLDELARRAAAVLQQARPPDAIAHGDWTCGNVHFKDSRVSSSYDWDSLAAAPEPVLVGLSASSFTSGSTAGATTPTPEEVTAFLRDYEELRSHPFDESEQRTAAAAVTWVLAYNARCQVSFLPRGGLLPGGSWLHALAIQGDAYLDLRW